MRPGPEPLCPAAPGRFLAGVGGTDEPSPGPGNHRKNKHYSCLPVNHDFNDWIYTNLHASGSVPQSSICPHLDGSVALLLCQLQYSCMVRYGLIEVPLRVVGAAQVAVCPCLFTPVLQSLPKTSFHYYSEITTAAFFADSKIRYF